MKYILLFFFAFTSIQAQVYSGFYTKNITTDQGVVIKYKLILEGDGTYKVTVFRNLGQKISIDENFYGKGNWKVINKLIVFSSEESSDKNYINLNETTSRFDAKNKKELRFFNCPSLWFKNVTLERIGNNF